MKNRTIYIDESLLVNPSKADEQVRVFQRKLYIRAKQEVSFKGYSLWDKVYHDYFLITAYRRVKKDNPKGRGVDDVGFSEIEKYGLHAYLSELQTELRTQSYRCSPLKHVEIPKEKKGRSTYSRDTDNKGSNCPNVGQDGNRAIVGSGL